METSRELEDTIHLLKECDSGTKMAVASFDEVLENIENEQMRMLLEDSREQHEKIGDELHELLLQHGEEDKEPNPIAKSMSWMKTNMKLTINESDMTIADLMTDGCDMGIKSLYRYMHQYKQADAKSVQLCRQLIELEEKLRGELQAHL